MTDILCVGYGDFRDDGESFARGVVVVSDGVCSIGAGGNGDGDGGTADDIEDFGRGIEVDGPGGGGSCGTVKYRGEEGSAR